MARARLPHCCDNDDDEDEVSREIGFDLTDARNTKSRDSIQIASFFRLLLLFRILL